MEREVSSAVSLATTLIAMSIVITLVMYTVIIGNGFKENIFESTAQIQTQLSSGQLNSLCNGDTKIMPKAAIYSILAQEHNAINSLTYTKRTDLASGATTIVTMEPASNGRWSDKYGAIDSEFVYPEDVMSNELTGKVTVEVEKNSYGTYDITVRDIEVN